MLCASNKKYAKQCKLHKEHVTGDFTSYWCYRHGMFADHCSTRAGAFRRRSWFHLFLFLRSSCADGGGHFLPARRSSKSSRFAIDCDFFLKRILKKPPRKSPVLSFNVEFSDGLKPTFHPKTKQKWRTKSHQQWRSCWSEVNRILSRSCGFLHCWNCTARRHSGLPTACWSGR